MEKLHLDLETYCELNLAEVGVRKYVSHPSFEILLVAYCSADGEVKVADLASGDPFPREVMDFMGEAQSDPTHMKRLAAHNANFERLAISAYLRKTKRFSAMLSPDLFYCTMIRAYQLGLPGSLERAGNILGLAPTEKKMAQEGKALIKLFCSPDKKTGKRTFPSDAPEKWARFKEYNARDVVAEMAIDEALSKYPPAPAREFTLYAVDQAINDRGVGVDLEMAKTVNRYIAERTDGLILEGRKVTKVENPNSLIQIKGWLTEKGYQVAKLDKETVAELLKKTDLDPEVKKYLLARRELGKTSVAKYQAMELAAVFHPEDPGYRLHGMLQMDGAIRTGRWAGRIVQLQNLPHDSPEDIAFARSLAAEGEFDLLHACYGNPFNVLSQLIRTAFIPKKGYRFVVADYSQIESRVAAWMTGESWKLEAFVAGKDIYKVNASKMYGKPIDEIDHDERAKGKVAELAGGYGGGVGAYKRFGADTKLGLTDDQIQTLVNQWRSSNPNICAAWKECEKAFANAVRNHGGACRLGTMQAFAKMYGDSLLLLLPSKRFIAYKAMRMERKDVIRFFYKDTSEKSAAIIENETYGGKIFENLIQGVARDCLAETLIRLEQRGYRTVFHVHDEVIVEVPIEKADEAEKDIDELMSLKDVPWLKGCPLKAESYQCDFYEKK